MIQLTRQTSVGSDETAGYNVVLDKEYTLKELLDEILSNTAEWGYFHVLNCSSCEYRWGKLVTELDPKYLNKSILKATASGGWSRMDYYITT